MYLQTQQGPPTGRPVARLVTRSFGSWGLCSQLPLARVARHPCLPGCRLHGQNLLPHCPATRSPGGAYLPAPAPACLSLIFCTGIQPSAPPYCSAPARWGLCLCHRPHAIWNVALPAQSVLAVRCSLALRHWPPPRKVCALSATYRSLLVRRHGTWMFVLCRHDARRVPTIHPPCTLSPGIVH